MKKTKKLLPFFIFALFLLGAFYYVISKKSQTSSSISSIKFGQNTPTLTPTPFPFASMTVPYLRSRNYQSSLGKLELYEKHANYTSYLTSYDSDGLKVNGLLTIPNGKTPQGGWPAIVFVHGYIAPTIYKTTERYVSYVDYLAKNDYVVFKIDLRGNGDSEGVPGGAYYSGDYIIDTLNAYSALQNSDFVNSQKVGLWGHSMAGNIVFRSFVAKKTIPAVVIWAGAGYTYTDLQEYRLHDNSYRPPSQSSRQSQDRQKLFNAHGSFLAGDEFWKQVVPVNYLEGVGGAIMIDHAVDDTVVSIQYSKNLMKILDETSIPHTLNEYQSGGHNISGASFTSAMKSTVAFFDKYLK